MNFHESKEKVENLMMCNNAFFVAQFCDEGKNDLIYSGKNSSYK
jgi:hypothetical protein